LKEGWIIEENYIIDRHDPILITGANGFIGSRVVEVLLGYGFGNLRCLARPSSNLDRLKSIADVNSINVALGNLISPYDCDEAAKGVSVVYHLAASSGDKSFTGAYKNTVDTTRYLLEAVLRSNHLKRFVNISSFAVYSNENVRSGALLDETSEVESHPELRGEAYCYAKVKQEELLKEYGRRHSIPYVILRPGTVYGPGNKEITARVGIRRLGLFLHLGGSNRIPLTYVNNCAEAIVLAGLRKGVDGEVFNVVDDDIPTSREFLRMYKKRVKHIKSIYLPKPLSYILCFLWENCSKLSGGRLPPMLNRKRWSAEWKGNKYSNEKLKKLLGWKPKVSLEEGLRRYFEYCREVGESNE